MKEIKTLKEAIRHFSDEQTCIDTVAQMRWPERIACIALVVASWRTAGNTIGSRLRDAGSAIRAVSNSVSKSARSSRIRRSSWTCG